MFLYPKYLFSKISNTYQSKVEETNKQNNFSIKNFLIIWVVNFIQTCFLLYLKLVFCEPIYNPIGDSPSKNASLFVLVFGDETSEIYE